MRLLIVGAVSTHAPDRVLEFRARLGRVGALTEGTITNWRFDNGLLFRLTFHAPNLTVEHGSQRQQVAVSWYSPYPPIIRPHLHCPTCDRGRYALYEVGGIFTCRICGPLDYACRHINRHTPQLQPADFGNPSTPKFRSPPLPHGGAAPAVATFAALGFTVALQ